MPQIASLETAEGQVLNKARKIAFGEPRLKMKEDFCLSERTFKSKPYKRLEKNLKGTKCGFKGGRVRKRSQRTDLKRSQKGKS